MRLTLAGYSVAVGEKSGNPLYFAGAPRFEHKGQVVLFRDTGTKWNATQNVSGDQVGNCLENLFFKYHFLICFLHSEQKGCNTLSMCIWICHCFFVVLLELLSRLLSRIYAVSERRYFFVCQTSAGRERHIIYCVVAGWNQTTSFHLHHLVLLVEETVRKWHLFMQAFQKRLREIPFFEKY